MSPSPPANLDSDVTSVASIGGSDVDSDYVKSAEKSPMIPANTPDLMGHISELEEMHKFTEGNLSAIAQMTVLFSHTNELEIPYIADAKTDPPENHKDNGATPPVNTQPLPSHLPLEDTLVDFAENLRYAHALRPSTPHFNHKRDTSRMSASLALATCYMVSTRIGYTKIQGPLGWRNCGRQ